VFLESHGEMVVLQELAMPELVLHASEMGLDGVDHQTLNLIRFNHLKAVAYYPNDDIKRIDLIRYLYKMLDIQLEEKIGHLYPVYRDYIKGYREYLGGSRKIAESSGTMQIESELKSINKRTMWVGESLTMMYCIVNQFNKPKLASLNRMVYLLDKPGIRPESSFQQDWADYKSVSHIWAAMFVDSIFEVHSETENLLYQSPEEPSQENDSPQMEDINKDEAISQSEPLEIRKDENILAWSLEFQRFGTSFKPLRAKTTILVPAEIWQVPDAGPWKRRPLFNIYPSVLSKLLNYRAPKSLD